MVHLFKMNQSPVHMEFATPLGGWVNWAALLLLLAHVGELLLFRARLQGLPAQWWQRLQVLLFGMLHLQRLR